MFRRQRCPDHELHERVLNAILLELIALNRKMETMANELPNLQAAAAAAIAKLNELKTALDAATANQGIPAADVQSVTDQLTAAVAAVTPAP